MRKTLKRKNKAGNRFLERKVQIASMFNGTQRDVTNMILREYATSRIQKSRRTMVSKNDFQNDFETRVPNFYNNLIRFIIVLRRTNPDINTVSAIKDDILRTIPDRTVAGLLRLPNLNEEINLLRNLLTNHFPPSNEKEIAELIEVADSIIRALNIPLHARITVPLLPYRQNGFVRRQTQRHALAEGRKRKSRHAKRRN
ncbi:hypothetical protein [Chrysochromulina parva virus BQ2]|jgi:hypothetical protein|uniref:Uncharacterized protein n=1 Tax=Chrysochromulina parva virus BQ2 TaxID=3070831 RepID=A0A4Y6GSK1_9VIRU|nr:hypothetical protein QKE47_gp16 [Chrysochromulina parva virus]QDF45907.1 hypothetical protein [Chrysochromulina parva virus BQ2]